MWSDISYRCNRVPLPERSSLSFDMNRTLTPYAYKSTNPCHVRNELIQLVTVFGIVVGHNKSSFEDVVELCFT